MRGNFLFLGRNDYEEPAPLDGPDLTRVQAVEIQPIEGNKTWRSAVLNGQHIGFVTSRMHGQYFRTKDMDSWMPVPSDCNRKDPEHAQAVLGLLNHIANCE